MSATARRKVEIGHFTMAGEDFTRLARDFVLSETPAFAWRFIVNGLHGDGIEKYAAKLLDGKIKFVGSSDDGFEPVEDNAEKYVEEIKYIYAGRVRIQGSWWRPRAEVLTFGPDDAAYANKRVRDPADEHPLLEAGGRGPGSDYLKRWSKARVEFYAAPGERVIEVPAEGRIRQRPIIFEPCGEPPFWWDEIKSPAAALEEFRAVGRTLDQLSWQDEYGPPPEEEPPRREDAIGQAAIHALQGELTLYDREEEEDRAYEARLAKIKATVLEQAKGDMIELTLKDGAKVPVPRAPFENWALRRTSLKHLAPPWTIVSPSGMKLQGDDPYHTDWLIGAGRDLDEAYNGPLNDAATDGLFEVQERLGHFKCGVLVGGKMVTGVVGENILVFPDLHPDRLEAMLKAEAVITQVGGKLAHLAQVAMEKTIPIMLVPDACTRYPDGTVLVVDPDSGVVVTHYTHA